MFSFNSSLYTFDFLSSSLPFNFSSSLYAFDFFSTLYTFNFSPFLLYPTSFTSIPTISEPVISEFSSVLNLSFSSSLYTTSESFVFTTNITRKYSFFELVNIPIFELNFITDNQALKFLSEMTALRRSDIAKVLTALRNLIKLSIENEVDKIYLLAFDIQILRKDDKTIIVISRY